MSDTWAQSCAKAFAPVKAVRVLIASHKDEICVVKGHSEVAIYSKRRLHWYVKSHIVPGYRKHFNTVSEAMAEYMSLIAKEK